MSKTSWTEDRHEELLLLESVIRMAGSLNQCTHVAEKILELQEKCEQLEKSDLREPRDSFLRFLNRLALTDMELKPCQSSR